LETASERKESRVPSTPASAGEPVRSFCFGSGRGYWWLRKTRDLELTDDTPILRDRVPYHGALGFFAVITLDQLNAFVGLMVGVATLVYLCLRIRSDISKRTHDDD
jgi:hypothetical protein